MVRSPSIDKNGMKKGEWSKEEDDKLRAYINRFGTWNWRQLPRFAGLARCGKSCRLRWKNYLQPNVKRGNYTKVEEDIIINLHNQLGKKWSVFAKHLPGRTDNEIKNYWHTHLKKRTQGQNLILQSNQENAESSNCQSSKILINTDHEEIKQESSKCENQDKQIVSAPQFKDLTSPNQSCCSVLSQSCSIQEDGVISAAAAAKSFESSADIWNQQLSVDDYESTPQGSTCSEFSFNCVNAPTNYNISDLMTWVGEDSTVMTSPFECFDDFWGQPFETDNQTTNAYKYEQPSVDPAHVYNLSSPITEDVFLWPYQFGG